MHDSFFVHINAYRSLKYSANSSLSLSALRRRVWTWSMPSLGRSVYNHRVALISLKDMHEDDRDSIQEKHQHKRWIYRWRLFGRRS